MLAAIATESKGGAVVEQGTPAEKAEAILAYLREHRLIDW
jgi:electron transfer flavoprotein beta subunit